MDFKQKSGQKKFLFTVFSRKVKNMAEYFTLWRNYETGR